MSTVIVALVIAVIVFFAIRSLVKENKASKTTGSSPCGGSCNGCSGCGPVNPEQSKKD